ncbi:unnamed protein product [Plutella xylostella]|uniref:(diamondback moth) hypothetical protein n=1 Tax=Plutella xylostella TaxID=51655 RepID=A0A8S4GBT2_PLUXY|nr:unnamed protein product [Plutella xylostella]
MTSKALVLLVVALHVVTSQAQPLVDQCGEAGYFPKWLIPGDEYYIYSSQSLGSYGGQKYCNWFTTCVAGRVRLDCPRVEMPESENCGQDHLSVQTSKVKVPRSYCGSSPIQELSEDSQMSVALVAPKNSKGGKFLCKISCVGPDFPAGPTLPAQPEVPEVPQVPQVPEVPEESDQEYDQREDIKSSEENDDYE